MGLPQLCNTCFAKLDTGLNCPYGHDQSSCRTDDSVELSATTEVLVELQHEYLELHQKYHKLKVLCDHWFIESSIKPYAGANNECLFCGKIEDRKGNTFHDSDCPIEHYKKINHST